MIPHIPDYESNVDPLPIDPADVWDNDIRIDKLMHMEMTHLEIDSNYGEVGSSSSSDDYYYNNPDLKHPIAQVIVVGKIITEYQNSPESSSSSSSPEGYYYGEYPLPMAQSIPVNPKSISLADKRWIWVSTDELTEAPITSNDIRILSTRYNNPINGNSYNISIPSGTTRVIFAYPSNLRDVSQVTYRQMGNADVKDTFTKSLITVEGLNESELDIEYKIYTYIPISPFNTDATYIVTI